MAVVPRLRVRLGEMLTPLEQTAVAKRLALLVARTHVRYSVPVCRASAALLSVIVVPNALLFQ